MSRYNSTSLPDWYYLYLLRHSVRNNSSSSAKMNKSSWLLSRMRNITNRQNNEYDGFQDSETFNGVYFSTGRLSTETILAAGSLLVNIVALVCLLCSGRGKKSPYQMLFTNLVVTNIFATALLWTSNNMLYLFEDTFTRKVMEGVSYCDVFLAMICITFISSSFGIVAVLTLLGFSAVQCLAIWKPLIHPTIIRRRTMCYYLVAIWMVSFFAAGLPLVVLYSFVLGRECDNQRIISMKQAAKVVANINIGVFSLAFCTILMLCTKIYADLRAFRKRQLSFRRGSLIAKEEKMFSTTLLLIASMTLFCIPYLILYVVWLNSKTHNPMDNEAVIYYMFMLPYLKFLSDPLVYGIRMKRVRQGWHRLCSRCHKSRDTIHVLQPVRQKRPKKPTPPRYAGCLMSTLETPM